MADKKKKVTVIENPNEQEILSASTYSFAGMVWSRFKRHKMAVFGFVILILMILMAICAPLFELMTGYPIKYAGGEPKHLPFTYPGVAVRIDDDKWDDPTVYPGGPAFWFNFATEDDYKKALSTGYATINMETFNSTYVDKVTGQTKAYKDKYVTSLKEYGRVASLDRKVSIKRDEANNIIRDSENKPINVYGDVNEFFVSRARLVKYHKSLNQQIDLYKPTPFTEIDSKIVEIKDDNGNVIYKGPQDEDLGQAPMHVLGTDGSGHDVLVRLAFGARISLFVSLVTVLLSTLIGIILGSIAGFYGGFIDATIQRIIEILGSIPQLPILLVLSAFLGNGSPIVLILILTVFGWTGTTRMIRGQFLSIRETEYAEAARAIGSSDWRTMFKHMLPNAIAPIIVSMTISIGGVIMSESSLSFLGLGINVIETPTWGGIINEARQYFMSQPWPSIFSGLMIFLVTLSSNFMGDGLRDAIDPRLKI
ncbi:MAG: ABC transporter permease [Caldisericia bacterium]|nr:ABC transporter permease [Caldisericia bacterium]